MQRKIFWGASLLIILSIFIFYSNCTKNSTRYEFPRDNFLYASDMGDSPNPKIYVFSTQTDSLVDSISLGTDLYATDLGLSPDKRTLYTRCERVLSDTSREYLGCEIDTRTKSLKYIGPNSFPIVSPDGKYLFGAVGNQFAIFDAHTHQIVYQDSTLFYPFCFDKKAHLAYGIKGDPRGMHAFNYESMRWDRSIILLFSDGTPLAGGPAVLSPDGRILYFIGSTIYLQPYFCVYDLIKDSLLVQLAINSVGQLGISPNGGTAYITDPGGGPGACIFWEPPPSGFVGIFDTKTNTPLPSISLAPFADSLHPGTQGAFYIKITSDGKKAYLSYCADRIYVIDLLRNEPLKSVIVPSSATVMLHFIAL